MDDSPGGARQVDYYYIQDWQLLQSETDAGGPIAVDQYVWSVTYIDAPVGRWHDHNGDGDFLDYTDDGQANDDWVRYFTRDGNQNVTATIEGIFDTGSQQWQWQLAERYVYTPYGEATVYDADWSNPAAPTTDGPLYCGYFFDAETSLYHVRHRYYHPTLSTWLTRDPLCYSAGDPNLYRYVGNSPNLMVDHTGLAQKRQWMWFTDGFAFGIDRGPELKAQGGFEIHVYRGKREIAKITGFGAWCKTHRGKSLCKPSDFKKQFPEVYKGLRTVLAQEARVAAKNGWRPNRYVSGARALNPRSAARARARVAGGVVAAFALRAEAYSALDVLVKNGHYARLLQAMNAGDIHGAEVQAGEIFNDLAYDAGNEYLALFWLEAWRHVKLAWLQAQYEAERAEGLRPARPHHHKPTTCDTSAAPVTPRR